MTNKAFSAILLSIPLSFSQDLASKYYFYTILLIIILKWQLKD